MKNEILRILMLSAISLIELGTREANSALEELFKTINKLTESRDALIERCRIAYETQGRVSAIKEWRSSTQSDLKTAIDEIDGLAKKEGWARFA